MPNIHQILVTSLDSIPALLTLVGNSIFMLTIFRTPSLHNPSNVLLGTLCLSDFLVGLIVQPLFFVNVLWDHGCYPDDWLTDIYYYIFVLFSGFSLLMAGFLSIDRYIAICHPFKYTSKIACKKYIIIIIIMCIFWATCSVSILMGLYKFWTAFFVVEVLVIMTIIIIYAKIYYVISKLKRNVVTVGETVEQRSSQGFQSQTNLQKKEREKSHTISIILGFFLFSYSIELGRSLHYLIKGEGYPCQNHGLFFTLDMWTDFFVLVNSCVNPIVYCVRSTDIRNAALRMFRRGHVRVESTREVAVSTGM